MKLKLNSLPSRTWNRLGMNETFIALEGEFANHTPEAVWDEKQVRWDPAADWNAEEIGLGTGADTRTLTAPASVGLVETAPDTVMEQPITLTWSYADGEEAVSRLVLHAAKNSTLSAVLLLRSPEMNSAGKAAVLTEIYAEENTTVNLYVAQLLGSEAVCIHDISGVCAEDATVNLTKLELGAGKMYAGTQIDLKGDRSNFNTEIAYHVLGGQLLDMNYVALHHGKKTNSLMEVNGTLEEGASKVFRGSIDFQRGCAGSKGTENENVLLLGDKMVNQTIPLILCKEEDVEGNHGASIGRLDDKVLFYLSTRGISEETAQQMIAQSRIETVCSKIPVEAIREEAHNFECKRGGIYDVAEVQE